METKLTKLIQITEQGVRAGSLFASKQVIPATNFLPDVISLAKEHQLEYGSIGRHFGEFLECIVEILIMHGADFEGSHHSIQALMGLHVVESLILAGIFVEVNDDIKLGEVHGN